MLSHMKHNWGIDVKSGISIVRGTTPIGSGYVRWICISFMNGWSDFLFCSVEEFLADEVFKAFQQDPEALLLLEQSENAAVVIETLKSRPGVGPAVKKCKKNSFF